MVVPDATASRNHATHSSDTPWSMILAATAPVPAPTPAPTTQPTGPPRIRPNRLAHRAPDSALRPGPGSVVSRTIVRPFSSFVTNTASTSFNRSCDARRPVAVRNSWARKVSANEMPTSVRGVPSVPDAGVSVMTAASHIATCCL